MLSRLFEDELEAPIILGTGVVVGNSGVECLGTSAIVEIDFGCRVLEDATAEMVPLTFGCGGLGVGVGFWSTSIMSLNLRKFDLLSCDQWWGGKCIYIAD